jgi:starch-binding outer membrane protein, SusD/RagB family
MKNISLIFSSVLVLTLGACKKVIDVRETDFIGGDIALKTVANNEAGVIGAYAAMNPEMSILFNAVMSDELKVGEFYNAATVHEWQFTSTDITIRDQFTAISAWYGVIDRVNRVLQALPNADSVKAGDNTLRSRVKGEALFIRAYAHFELFRFYAGNYDPAGLAMPYREVPSLQGDARITMDPYFQKLRADLTEAKTLLPALAADRARANRIAAAGLQARVALYLKDWETAKTAATEYITALPLATMAQFPYIWTDSLNTEIAFKLRRTPTAGGRIGSLFRGTSANANNIGTVVWLPSSKLINSYDSTTDIRFSSYFLNEPRLTAAGRPSLIIKKYAGTPYGTPFENVADAKMFRTSEMYLIRAEARAETNDLDGAASDINTLRANRITGYTPMTFTSKEQVISEILLERFRELAFEGHRFWDLKRKNLPVERLPADAPNATSVTLPAGNFRFLLPIPNFEIQANPLIQQNPGYTN